VVEPYKNNDSDGPELLNRPLDRPQIFIGVFGGCFLLSNYGIATR
jgi:hypothetical protein